MAIKSITRIGDRWRIWLTTEQYGDEFLGTRTYEGVIPAYVDERMQPDIIEAKGIIDTMLDNGDTEYVMPAPAPALDGGPAPVPDAPPAPAPPGN